MALGGRQNSKVKSKKTPFGRLGIREYRKERKGGKGHKEIHELPLRPLPPLRYSRIPPSMVKAFDLQHLNRVETGQDMVKLPSNIDFQEGYLSLYSE
jgi:hypothetical protein